MASSHWDWVQSNRVTQEQVLEALKNAGERGLNLTGLARALKVDRYTNNILERCHELEAAGLVKCPPHYWLSEPYFVAVSK